MAFQLRRVACLLIGITVLLMTGCGSRSTRIQGESTQELLLMLESPDTSIKVQAAVELRKHGKAMRDAIGPLRAMLRSEDALQRETAAGTLAVMGPDAKDAVPELISCLADTEWTIRRQAALALGEIGERQVRGDLEKLLQDPIQRVRDAARESIGKLR